MRNSRWQREWTPFVMDDHTVWVHPLVGIEIKETKDGLKAFGSTGTDPFSIGMKTWTDLTQELEVIKGIESCFSEKEMVDRGWIPGEWDKKTLQRRWVFLHDKRYFLIQSKFRSLNDQIISCISELNESITVTERFLAAV